jgi:hypothetical protein
MKMWEMKTYEGVSRMFRPDQAEVIRRKMKTDKHIYLHNDVIAVADIRSFEELEQEEGIATLALPEPTPSPSTLHRAEWLELMRRNKQDQQDRGKYGPRRTLDDLNYTPGELALFEALGWVEKVDTSRPKVYYKWGKRTVTSKEFDRKYANATGIVRLETKGSDIVVAFKVIVGVPLKEGVGLCSDLESYRLEQHTAIK